MSRTNSTQHSTVKMDQALQLKVRVSVVELRAKVKKASADGTRLDKVIWGKLQEACPNLVATPGTGSIVATCAFPDEDAAMKAVVALWESRLQGMHHLTPELRMPSVEINRKLNDDLRRMFLECITRLTEGTVVTQHSESAKKLHQKIADINVKLKKRRRMKLEDLVNRKAEKEDLIIQHEQISLRITEFKRAMESLICTVTGLAQDKEESGARSFTLGHGWTWCQVHSILERECERLGAQLPLYARRSDILSRIHANQVTVLVGETGSGKSTQLVQYLADAGYVGAGKSVVCTQPRKVAAMTLTQRVKDESDGCIKSSSPVGYMVSSGAQHCTHFADITFTTDFYFLQLCLKDSLLKKFSCIVVDEAHERSLNTDLLLALLKMCMSRRPELKVVIMSATADANLLSAYFSSGEVLRVPGRNFPVGVIYESENSAAAAKTGEDKETEYLAKVVNKVRALHQKEGEGNILAFLTSPSEVEWACGQGFGASAVVLPFHGRLPNDDLQRVFKQNSRVQRKIVFATNFAETSLTIPDVKFVVDCGLAKDSMFDSQTGMNVLKVGKIDQSSAIQRAGRAGRTQAGLCYRLYSKAEFDIMSSHKLPEIKRVHLGVAILRLLALGIKDPNNFDFVEPPDHQAILLAMRGLDQLGAVKQSGSGERFLTALGWKLVRLGIDPRLGKILLDSIAQGYGQDGVVIAALMLNSRRVFHRSGSEEAKARADRLKLRFCHPHGDLFTLLSVYQEWDSLPECERVRNEWCRVNSINAKALKSCRDQVNEMKTCLLYELNVKVSSSWGWSPRCSVATSTPLRKIIFSAMPANLAVFSGHDRVGYDVVSLKQQAYLHPACSVLAYGTIPEFVVFGEILHTSGTFLVAVTVVDPGWFMPLSPSLSYDVAVLESSIMRKWVVPVTGNHLLARVCGKQGRNLILLINKIQEKCKQRCVIDYSYDKNILVVFTTAAQMEDAKHIVKRCIERERRWMDNECMEKLLIRNSCRSISSPAALCGAGGLIRDMLMPEDYAAVEVMYQRCSKLEEVDDEELLELFDQCGEGISGYDKVLPVPASRGVDNKEDEQQHKWGIIRFCSRSAAEVAVELLNGVNVSEAKLHLRALVGSTVNNFRRAPFPTVKATLAWARRRRKGWATVTFAPEDSAQVLTSFQDRVFCGSVVSVKPDRAKVNTIFFNGLDGDVDEKTLKTAVSERSRCRVIDVYMPRHSAPLLQPSVTELHEMLTQEITPFVPKDKFHVSVFEPKEKDYVGRAVIRFEEAFHQEGTSALAHLEGLVLPGCQPWQTISHQRLFSSQVHCSRSIFGVVEEDLLDLVKALEQQHPGTKVVTTVKEHGFHAIKVISTSLAVAAGCKSAIEKLMEGQPIADDNLGESAVRLLLTKKGSQLAKAVENLTQTLVICDKRTQVAKVFGPKEKKAVALQELVSGLAGIQSDVKRRQVVLRGDGIPFGLMREIVKLYGPDLHGLRDLVGITENINIDLRGHLLSVEGNDMDTVAKVQEVVAEVAQLLDSRRASTSEDSPAQFVGDAGTGDNECPICFCPREKQHYLEGCGHGFCRSCLIDQVNSAIRHREGFPLTCARDGCSQLFLVADLHVLLTEEQHEDLLRASLSTFVAQSHGRYRYCTTPDCLNVYRVSTDAGNSFVCAACSVHLCTACHVEYHEGLSCADYWEFKLDPDASLQAWRKGKEKDVKSCPGCTSVIEKVDGCNHMACKCGKHVCWVCLSIFADPRACYYHLREFHGGNYGDRDGIE